MLMVTAHRPLISEVTVADANDVVPSMRCTSTVWPPAGQREFEPLFRVLGTCAYRAWLGELAKLRPEAKPNAWVPATAAAATPTARTNRARVLELVRMPRNYFVTQDADARHRPPGRGAPRPPASSPTGDPRP